MSSQFIPITDNPPAYHTKEEEAAQTQPAPPVQYVVAAPFQTTTTKPNIPGPHDFLLFIVVAVIICAILNLVSLIIGFPAIAFAIFAHDLKVSRKNYPRASIFSTVALALVITDIFLTLLGSFVIVAAITGLFITPDDEGIKCSLLWLYDGQGYTCR